MKRSTISVCSQGLINDIPPQWVTDGNKVSKQDCKQMGGEWVTRYSFFFFFLLQRYLNRPRNNKCLKVRTCTSQLISPLSTLIFDSDLNLNSIFNMDKFRTMDMPLNLFKLSGFSLMQKARKHNVFPMTLLSELRLYVKCLIECL